MYNPIFVDCFYNRLHTNRNQSPDFSRGWGHLVVSRGLQWGNRWRLTFCRWGRRGWWGGGLRRSHWSHCLWFFPADNDWCRGRLQFPPVLRWGRERVKAPIASSSADTTGAPSTWATHTLGLSGAALSSWWTLLATSPSSPRLWRFTTLFFIVKIMVAGLKHRCGPRHSGTPLCGDLHFTV